MNSQSDGHDTSSDNGVKAADASSGAAGQKENRIRQIEITDEIYARRGGKEWPVKGRIAQVAPEEVVLKHVDVWLMIGGRGSGKTRAGAEWVNAIANGYMPYARGHKGQIALIGETLADVRDVMIEGPAGILATGRNGKPRFESSRRRVVWETGMTALVFSSEDPESLRGPQFGAAWCDEIGKWKNGDATWDMLQFGLRLGARPQLLATTTPRATQLIKRLMADPAAYVTRVKTLENADNLAPGFLDRLIKRYGGTRLARQELDGELIEDCDDALWKRGALEGLRGAVPEDLRRIVVAVDPPTTSGKQADACGIVAAGLTGDGMVHVLADASIKRAAPAVWAAAAVRLFKELQADCILAEVNQGGEMVENVIRTVDKDVPVRTARASRGKWLRAEPVAALYEQGKVRHAGRFAELEDEMCNFGRDGLAGGRSPDRVDALVWAVSELVFGEKDKPRVRSL